MGWLASTQALSVTRPHCFGQAAPPARFGEETGPSLVLRTGYPNVADSRDSSASRPRTALSSGWNGICYPIREARHRSSARSPSGRCWRLAWCPAISVFTFPNPPGLPTPDSPSGSRLGNSMSDPRRSKLFRSLFICACTISWCSCLPSSSGASSSAARSLRFAQTWDSLRFTGFSTAVSPRTTLL